MKDFRKYATKHLGINGMVLDDVMSAQAQYLRSEEHTSELQSQR